MTMLYVAGAGTDIGKTYVTANLLAFLRSEGVDARALKPVMSGFDPQHPAASDAGILLGAMGRSADASEIEAMAPLRFRAALSPDMAARREGRILRLAEILEHCRAPAHTKASPLLIESVGGIMSPIAEDATSLDLLRALQCPALLVVGSYLGAISHALTALSACASHGGEVRALVVNESASSAVSLDETCEALSRFCGATPVIAAPRGAAPNHPVWRKAALLCGLMAADSPA